MPPLFRLRWTLGLSGIVLGGALLSWWLIEWREPPEPREQTSIFVDKSQAKAPPQRNSTENIRRALARLGAQKSEPPQPPVNWAPPAAESEIATAERTPDGVVNVRREARNGAAPLVTTARLNADGGVEVTVESPPIETSSTPSTAVLKRNMP